MGNKCQCVSSEKAKEMDLQKPEPEQKAQARPVRVKEKSRAQANDWAKSRSSSNSDPNSDYCQCLQLFEEASPRRLKEIDDESRKLLSYKTSAELPVTNRTVLESFLSKRAEHNFIEPSQSPFLLVLAKLEADLTKESSSKKSIDNEGLISEFLKNRGIKIDLLDSDIKNSKERLSLDVPKRKVSALKIKDVDGEKITRLENPESSKISPAASQSNLDKLWPSASISRSSLHGPLLLASGEIYFGGLKKGLKDGYGIQIWPNGAIFEGYWLDGRPNILGLMVFSDGDSYAGEWKEGKMNGLGIFVSTKDFKYEGHFLNNEPHGKGKEIWKNGITLRGTWASGKRSGFFEVLNDDWILKGAFEGIDSLDRLQLERNEMTWEVPVTSGVFDGQFKCLKKRGSSSFQLLGETKRGLIIGNAEAKCGKRTYQLVFKKKELVEARLVGHSEPLKISKGKLEDPNCPSEDKDFLFRAIEDLKDVKVPFL